jgi:WD40 repeat protein
MNAAQKFLQIAVFWTVATLQPNPSLIGKERATLEKLAGGWSLAYSPDGKWLATGLRAGERRVNIWSAESCKLWASLRDLPGFTHYIAFSADGKTLVTGGPGAIINVIDIPNKRLRSSFALPAKKVMALAFVPDEPLVAVVVIADNAEVLFVDPQTYQVRHMLPDKDQTITKRSSGIPECGISFSADGTLMAVGMRKGTVLWDVKKRQVSREILLADGWTMTTALSPDGRFVATLSSTNTLRFLDASTGKEIATFVDEMYRNATCLVFSPSGKWLHCACESRRYQPGHIDIFSVNDCQRVGRFSVQNGPGICGAFSPDGKSLVVSSLDGTVKVWDVDAVLPRR